MPNSKLTAAEIGAARKRGAVKREQEVHAVAASYDAKSDRIAIELESGCALLIPRGRLQGLEKATPTQLRRVEVLPTGSAIAWTAPDVGFLVEDLAQRVIGSRRWMSALGRYGGLATSPRKAASSRKNGAKGGRPTKRAS